MGSNASRTCVLGAFEPLKFDNAGRAIAVGVWLGGGGCFSFLTQGKPKADRERRKGSWVLAHKETLLKFEKDAQRLVLRLFFSLGKSPSVPL